jgi:hypothetical protein
MSHLCTGSPSHIIFISYWVMRMHVCSIFYMMGQKIAYLWQLRKIKKIVNALVVFDVLQNHSHALTMGWAIHKDQTWYFSLKLYEKYQHWYKGEFCNNFVPLQQVLWMQCLRQLRSCKSFMTALGANLLTLLLSYGFVFFFISLYFVDTVSHTM